MLLQEADFSTYTFTKFILSCLLKDIAPLFFLFSHVFSLTTGPFPYKYAITSGILMSKNNNLPWLHILL